MLFILDAEGRFNPATAGPAEIEAYKTLVAQTRQAELKQSVDHAATKEKMGGTDFSVKPETELADEEYTGDRDPA